MVSSSLSDLSYSRACLEGQEHPELNLHSLPFFPCCFGPKYPWGSCLWALGSEPSSTRAGTPLDSGKGGRWAAPGFQSDTRGWDLRWASLFAKYFHTYYSVWSHSVGVLILATGQSLLIEKFPAHSYQPQSVATWGWCHFTQPSDPERPDPEPSILGLACSQDVWVTGRCWRVSGNSWATGQWTPSVHSFCCFPFPPWGICCRVSIIIPLLEMGTHRLRETVVSSRPHSRYMAKPSFRIHFRLFRSSGFKSLYFMSFPSVSLSLSGFTEPFYYNCRYPHMAITETHCN